MSDKLNNRSQAWSCKIGIVAGVAVPSGGDAPMRAAVQATFRQLTGVEARFTFSGWGAKLTESELAVVENRAPNYSGDESPNEWAERIARQFDAMGESYDAKKLRQLAALSQPSGGVFTEKNGKALRGVKPGEVLTEAQWAAVCAYVRDQEAVIDAYEEQAAAPPQEAKGEVCGAPKDGRTCYPDCGCDTENDCEYGTAAPPQSASQPSGEVDGLPQGWRVEPMDAPADRLLVTSREGAQVVIGPDSWKQTLGSHVLYSLIRDLAAAPPQEAKGEACPFCEKRGTDSCPHCANDTPADARGGEVEALLNDYEDAILRRVVRPTTYRDAIAARAALIRQLSAAGPAVALISPGDLARLRNGCSDVPVFNAGTPVSGYLPLYAGAAPVAVTDEMLERALKASRTGWHQNERMQMRASLTAALSAAAHQEGGR
jgi:hypothetical protein